MTESDLVYSGKWTPFSRTELMQKVSAQMSEQRFLHVLRVEKTALELAKHHACDLEKVSIAALLHDYAKERPDDESQDVIISENLDLELLKFGNNIWHGPVGAIMIQKEAKIEDPEILAAVRNHTIGSIRMSMLEKIIYVADYSEPGRVFPTAEEVRLLSKSNLDDALRASIQHTLAYLLKEKLLIYPKAIEVYNAWVPKNQEDIQ